MTSDRRQFAICSAALALAITTCLLLSAPHASAAMKTYQCQHPTTTGQEAFKLKNVSPKTACTLVRSLARLIHNGEKPAPLYRCADLTKSHPGFPVLNVHHFEGWTLQIRKRYEFFMVRGESSFGVIGTDFPLNCT